MLPSVIIEADLLDETTRPVSDEYLMIQDNKGMVCVLHSIVADDLRRSLVDAGNDSQLTVTPRRGRLDGDGIEMVLIDPELTRQGPERADVHRGLVIALGLDINVVDPAIAGKELVILGM